MKEYKILFEDQENGLEVPVILEVCGENFFDAIGKFHNEIAQADFGSEEKIA